MKDKKRTAATLAACLAASASAHAAVITFEDVPLGPPAGPEGVWNGSDESGGLNLGGVDFPNQFTDFGGGFTSWSGFAFSDHTDVTTPGFGNQYSAFAGGGHAGSSQYAVSFGDDARILFNTTVDGSNAGAWFTNTTYAAIAMRDGDSFARQFEAGDFFTLRMQGFLNDTPGGMIDYTLADFTAADPSEHFIVDDWEWVGFGGLGSFDEIRFSYESTDTGQFGINTPTYFAMDTLVIPEPGTAAFLALPALILVTRRGRRSSP